MPTLQCPAPRFCAAALLLFAVFILPLRAAEQIDLRGMGFVTGIAIHPQSSDLVYARTDVGGLFRWDAGNSKWLPLMDQFSEAIYQDRFSIESVALDPNNTNRVFVATGLKISDADLRPEILRSDDRGATWTALGLPDSVEIGGNNFWRWAGERLQVDPYNGSVLYFGSRQDGLQISRDGGNSWSRQSNVPAGDHGGKVTSGQNENGGVTFVAIDGREKVWSPERAKTVYVGVMGGGVWRSADGGNTFSKLTGGPADSLNPIQGRVAADGTLYVTFSPDDGVNTGGAVYAYEGAWRNITPSGSVVFNGVRRWVGIAVDPNNSDRIALSNDGNFPREFFLSTDRGANWISVGNDAAYNRFLSYSVPDWYDDNDHKYSRAGGLAFDPGNGNRLWLTTGFGVYRTDDVWASSVHLQMKEVMKGLEEIVVTQVFAYPQGGSNAFAATVMDKVGFNFKDANTLPDKKMGLGNFSIANGTGFAFSWNQPDHQVIVGGTHDYSGTVAARSTDGGASWNQMSLPTGSAPNWGSTIAGNVAVSATNSNQIVWVPLNPSWYSGGHVPVYSSNGGASWVNVNGLPASSNPVNQIWFRSRILVSDTVDGNSFYYYEERYPNAQIYRSTDGGRNFSVVNSTDVPGQWVVQMQAAPGVEDELWIGVDGKGVFYSRDGGESFTAAGSWEDFFSFAVGPRAAQGGAPMLYVHGKRAGQEAVFLSEDWGNSWTQLEVDVPLVKIQAMAASLQQPGDLIFGLSGRGLFYYSGSATTPPGGDGGTDEPGSGSSDNLLTNPGFDGNLNGWSTWSNGSYAAGAGVSGGAGRAGVENASGWGAVVQDVALEPNTSYTFGGSGMLTQAGDAELILKINDGTSSSTHSIDFSGTTSYSEKSLSVTTPASVSWAQFYFIYHGGNGSFLMDELFLTSGDAGSESSSGTSGADSGSGSDSTGDTSSGGSLGGTLQLALANVSSGDTLQAGAEFTVEISASDDITKVQMWYADSGSDWNWLGEDSTNPYALSLNVPSSLKNLRVRGFNASGQASSDLVVNVTASNSTDQTESADSGSSDNQTDNSSADTTSPEASGGLSGTLTVGLANIAEGDVLTVGDTVTLKVSTSADITKVYLWYANASSDWNWLGGDSTAPFELGFQVPSGLENIRVRGYDNANQTTADFVVPLSSEP